MSLLNNSVALIITASLAVQIIVLSLLIYGYFLKRKLKFRQHGTVMAAAVVLHLTIVFYVMVPSFVLAVIPDYSVPAPLSIVSIVGVIHAILVATALSLGFWLVGSWRFRRNLQGCFNKKKIMLKTIVNWAVALVLGIILYAIFIRTLMG